MTLAVAQFSEIEQILAEAGEQAVRLDCQQAVIAASAVFRAQTQEALNDLEVKQAGTELQDGLAVALRLMEQAKSTHNLLTAAQLALSGSHLSDVCMFSERGVAEVGDLIEVSSLADSRAFRPKGAAGAD